MCVSELNNEYIVFFPQQISCEAFWQKPYQFESRHCWTVALTGPPLLGFCLLLITECDLTTIWKSTHHSPRPGWLIQYGCHSITVGWPKKVPFFLQSLNHCSSSPPITHSLRLHPHLWTGPLVFLCRDKECVIAPHLFQLPDWQLWQHEGKARRNSAVLPLHPAPLCFKLCAAFGCPIHPPTPTQSACTAAPFFPLPRRAKIPSSLYVSVAVAVLTH